MTLAAALLLGTVLALAQSDAAQGARWPQFPVRFDASLMNATDDFEDFIYETFAAWNGIPNTRIKLTYGGETSSNTSCEEAGCHNGKDLINVIAVTVNEDVGGTIQGQTFIRCAGGERIDDGCVQAQARPATIVEADIVIEGNHFEYYYDNDYDVYSNDLRRTLMHLVGLALGFTPPADDGAHANRLRPDCAFYSVMYSDFCNSPTLTEYDIDMALAKYPQAEGN